MWSVVPIVWLVLASSVHFGLQVRGQEARVIDTIAGNTTAGFSGDGGPATLATLRNPASVAVGSDGSIYTVDFSNLRIRRVAPDGTISTFAGNGQRAFAGDGGPATAASFVGPRGITVGLDGSVYIADLLGYRVRRVGLDGIISTVAGSGSSTFGGDGGPATEAGVAPSDVAFDRGGYMYIADVYNNRIRSVDQQGIISTFAGNGEAGFSGDGVFRGLQDASFRYPYSIAFGPTANLDPYGSLYISDIGNNRIRKIRCGRGGCVLQTVAGNGASGYEGDGGNPVDTPINPAGLAVTFGPGIPYENIINLNVYFADQVANRIRVVSDSSQGFYGDNGGESGENISTAVGNGVRGFGGDGGPPTQASLRDPFDVAFTEDGTMYIADFGNNVIRVVSDAGTTTSVRTTDAQTTDVQTTGVQTTNAQTTDVQTTDVQTTDVQTTDVQTTDVQTTDVLTTGVQTTDVQTTDVQTTDVQTTDVQTTGIQTTDVQTTGVQTTDVQTTDVQTTGVQTTDVQTTGVQTTDVQTTDVQTTGVQTTGVQTTDVQTTGIQTTGVQTTAVQSTAIQSDCRLRDDQTIDGYNIGGPFVSTRTLCCYLCQQVDSCNFFIFAPSLSICALKSVPANYTRLLRSQEGVSYGVISGRFALTTGAKTTSVQTTGVRSTGVQTTAVKTTGRQTTAVQTTGLQTTGRSEQCTGYSVNLDVSDSYQVGLALLAGDQSECCAACRANSRCNFFSFYNNFLGFGFCVLKSVPAGVQPSYRSGYKCAALTSGGRSAMAHAEAPSSVEMSQSIEASSTTSDQPTPAGFSAVSVAGVVAGVVGLVLVGAVVALVAVKKMKQKRAQSSI